MRTPLILGLWLTAVLVVAGCSKGGGGTSPGSAQPTTAAPAIADALDGRTFLSQSASGYTLAAGSQVTLRFDGGRIGASAGCNQMSGGYEIVDGVLKLGVMAMTEMACEEPLMAQDQWLAAFLPGAAPTIDGDTLTLTNGSHGLILTARD